MLAGVPLVEPMQESAMRLDSEEAPYEEIAAAIQGVEGVLAHGLLLDTVTEALVVGPDGPQTLNRVRHPSLACPVIRANEHEY